VAAWLLVVGAACGGGDDGAADGGDDGSTAEADVADDSPPADVTDDSPPADVAHDGAVGDCGPDGGPTSGFHVTVDGTPGGDGSLAAPWDLATALAHPAAVRPGDTIWVHGGVYPGAFTARLAGTAGAPITVRVWPGDWATIDGGPSEELTFVVQGEWAVYWGLELTNSRTDRVGGRPEAIQVLGPQLKLINLLIHDGGNCGFWSSAIDLEVYGCLIYNNGYDDDDRAHGHGFYTQNLDGTKRVEDNLIFNGYSFGVHAYTEGGSIQGFEFVGNVWFGNGVAAAGTGTEKDNCLVGGLQPAARVVLRENLGWAPGPEERSVRLGYDFAPNEDVALYDNYFVGQTNFATAWNSITMTGNTFYGGVPGIDTAAYPDNTYVTTRPAEARVFVRPNRWEPKRAHVVVYNWALAETVDVDLSGVLEAGDGYEVRNAQNWFAGPVLTGTYDGAPLALPMTGVAPAQPIGNPTAIDATEQTGREFQVFVVLGNPGACLPAGDAP
jgi:hypothetical protein